MIMYFSGTDSKQSKRPKKKKQATEGQESKKAWLHGVARSSANFLACITRFMAPWGAGNFGKSLRDEGRFWDGRIWRNIQVSGFLSPEKAWGIHPSWINQAVRRRKDKSFLLQSDQILALSQGTLTHFSAARCINKRTTWFAKTPIRLVEKWQESSNHHKNSCIPSLVHVHHSGELCSFFTPKLYHSEGFKCMSDVPNSVLHSWIRVPECDVIYYLTCHWT